MMTYFLILALLIVLELVYFKVADRYDIIDSPNERGSHTQVTLRGGGIIFLMGVWLWVAFFGWQYPWFLAGLTMISIVSFWDDVQSLPASVRLLMQFLTMGLVLWQVIVDNIEIIQGVSPWLLILIGTVVLFIAVGIVNAYNFMDGINGITGGYSIAVLAPMLYLDTLGLESIGLTEAFIAPPLLVVTLLAALVFCFFNFRKKARCFAGDVGSIGVAFIIVFALSRLMSATKDVTYIVFLLLYGVDTVLTILHRIMLHENLGQAHRKHAFQLMANELKIPHTTVATFYMVLQLVISCGMFLTEHHWIYFIATAVLMGLAYLIFMKKFYHLHEKYLKELNGED